MQYIIILLIGLIYAQIDIKSSEFNQESLANVNQRTSNKYTFDNRKGIRPGGDLFRSSRSPTTRRRDSQAIKIQTPDKVATKTQINYMLFFTMSGCKACEDMLPKIKELQNRGYEIYVVERHNRNLLENYSVTKYPTLIIFENKQQIKRFNGVTTNESITRHLKKPPLEYRLWQNE